MAGDRDDTAQAGPQSYRDLVDKVTARRFDSRRRFFEPDRAGAQQCFDIVLAVKWARSDRLAGSKAGTIRPVDPADAGNCADCLGGPIAHHFAQSFAAGEDRMARHPACPVRKMRDDSFTAGISDSCTRFLREPVCNDGAGSLGTGQG